MTDTRSPCACRDLWGNPYVGKGTQVIESSCPVHGSDPQSSLCAFVQMPWWLWVIVALLVVSILIEDGVDV